MENSPTAAQSGDPRKVAEFWQISSNNHHHKGGRKALIDCWWLISLTKSTGVIFLIINQLIMIVLDDCWWLTTLTPTTGGLAAFFKLLCLKDPSITKENLEAVGEADAASLLEGQDHVFFVGRGKSEF